MHTALGIEHYFSLSSGVMDIYFKRLSAGNRGEFIVFFERNDTPETKRNFAPFEFSKTALEEMFDTIKSDIFLGVFNKKNEVLAFGMLRGWDEGYDVPSMGVLVTKDMRGKGIGGQLITQLLKMAKERRSKQVRLSVYEDNKRAMNLYRKHGFVETEKQEISHRIKWIMYHNVK